MTIDQLFTKVANHVLAKRKHASYRHMTVLPIEAAASRYLADPTDQSARDHLEPIVAAIIYSRQQAKKAATA